MLALMLIADIDIVVDSRQLNFLYCTIPYVVSTKTREILKPPGPPRPASPREILRPSNPTGGSGRDP